jgi:hypothetical protein
MNRLILILAGALAAVALIPRAASACTMQFVDMFTRYDGAAGVAEVDVTAVGKTGEVTLTRVSTLKGDGKVALTGRDGGMCPPNYAAGTRVIAFVDGAGLASWIEGDSKPVLAALKKWQAAKTVKQKVRLLKSLAKSKDDAVKLHATGRIAADKATATAGWGMPDPAWSAPGSGKAATARLVALWPAIKSGASNAQALAGMDATMTAGTCTGAGTAVTAKAAAASVRDTMGTTDPSVVGSLAALDALGDAKLWQSSCGAGFDTLEAYIKQSDGALVMLWMVPEG